MIFKSELVSDMIIYSCVIAVIRVPKSKELIRRAKRKEKVFDFFACDELLLSTTIRFCDERFGLNSVNNTCWLVTTHHSDGKLSMIYILFRSSCRSIFIYIETIVDK